MKSLLFTTIDIFHADNSVSCPKVFNSKIKRALRQIRRWHQHEAVIKKANASPVIFEFGAGKDLAQNLFLSSWAGKQYLVDLNFMLDLDLCESARLELVENSILEDRGELSSVNDLLKYGIHYKAPADAANTDLADESIDVCIYATLEHIQRFNM